MVTRDRECHPPESHPSGHAAAQPTGDPDTTVATPDADTSPSTSPSTSTSGDSTAPLSPTLARSHSVIAPLTTSGPPVGPPRPPDSTLQQPMPVFRTPAAPPVPPQAPPVPPQAPPPRPVNLRKPTASPSSHTPASHTPAAVAPAPAPPAPAAPPSAAPTVARYQHLPMRAPTPVPTVAPELERAQGKPLSGDSAAQRTGRSLRRLVSSTARKTAETTATAAGVQQQVTVGRHIAVSSIRGGAGKTTVAALLGLTYAHHRRDAVLTLEADPALGTLPIRMGAESVRWTCGDVARIVTPTVERITEPVMQLTDITGYLVQLSQGGWLLPGSQGTVGVRLELEEYAAVMTALRNLFGVAVVDCETLPAELARAALHAAHARVLVAPATVEGVMSTRSVLDWMLTLPRPTLPSTVVVLTQSSPDMTLDQAMAAQHLGIAGVSVVSLPYDRHLAAGGAIQMSHLGQSTRETVTRLAAALMDRAVRIGR